MAQVFSGVLSGLTYYEWINQICFVLDLCMFGFYIWHWNRWHRKLLRSRGAPAIYFRMSDQQISRLVITSAAVTMLFLTLMIANWYMVALLMALFLPLLFKRIQEDLQTSEIE